MSLSISACLPTFGVNVSPDPLSCSLTSHPLVVAGEEDISLKGTNLCRSEELRRAVQSRAPGSTSLWN